MNRLQQQFLERVAVCIPQLLEAIAQGNEKSLFVLGTRTVEGKQVRLMLVAEVVDNGGIGETVS